MRKELKISTLSIVCALCTAAISPAFGASSVRALGGAGTYSSASSAAAAKSGSGAVSVKRPVTRTTSSSNKTSGSTTGGATAGRAAATPRLSIGKYLSGSSAVLNPSGASGSMKPGQAEGNLQERIEVLESFMGYSNSGPTIAQDVDSLQIKVKELSDDLTALKGVQTTVDYVDGVLTVTQGANEPVAFDLKNDFASLSVVAALQAAVDEITGAEYLTAEDLSELNSEVDALVLADEKINAAIDSLKNSQVTNEKVAELETADAELRGAISALQNSVAGIDDLAKTEYVDGLVAALQAEDARLSGLITALKQPDVDLAYVDEKVAGLQSSIDGLVAADASLTERVAGIENDLATYATKTELDQQVVALTAKIDAVQKGEIVLDDYYKAAQVDALLADKANQADLDAVSAIVSANTNSINSLNTAMGSKAEAEDVSELSGTVVQLQGQINTVSENAAAANLAAQGAQAGVDGLAQTVAAYGDVVTYNADAFATAAQGALADTAVQPEDLSEYGYVAADDLATQVTQLFENKSIAIPDGSVTAEKLADNAVTTRAIDDGAVTANKIDDGGAVAVSEETGAYGYAMLTRNAATGEPEWVAVEVF
ncbi:MAG: hypothetical protein IJD52_02330 [Alphaproteobacteria bacterium]|nr:hypothetical protein [Alphaproteobacteria bacterium]